MKMEGAGADWGESAGKKELILPVRFKDGKAKLVQQFVW